MKNQFSVQGEVVTMVVQDREVTFDLVNLPEVQQFGQWKLWKGSSVYTDFRDAGRMCKITLHKLLTGSRFVRWLDGNQFNFCRKNLEPVEKGTRNRAHGVNLKGNEYQVKDGRLVIIIKGKTLTYEAYADLDDYQLISKYTWNRNPMSGYAQAKERLGRLTNKSVAMHRIIMGMPDSSLYVDHINGDKLDNRKCNLRLCSNSENLHNTHRHRIGEAGVSKTADGYWTAQMQVNGVPHRKTFKTFEEAVQQYKTWEEEFNPTGLFDRT